MRVRHNELLELISHHTPNFCAVCLAEKSVNAIRLRPISAKSAFAKIVTRRNAST